MALTAAPAPLVAETLVPAPVAAVWSAFTTEDGMKSFFAPSVRIEAKVGGAYEPLFMPDAPAGTRGAEGCTITAIEAKNKLVFTWSFPPTLPSLRALGPSTTVTVTFTTEGKGTRVKLTHEAWKDGDDWFKGRAYFEKAWPLVLARLAHRFRLEPIDWTHAWGPTVPQELSFIAGTWRMKDGATLHEETWTQGPAGLLGAYRVSEGASAKFFELSVIESDGAELLLRMRMFRPGLVSAGEKPLEFMLHGIDDGIAIFRGVGGEKGTTLSYEKKGEGLRVTLMKSDGATVFDFTK